MDESLKNIIMNGENVNLTETPIEKLKEMLSQIEDEETIVKQEIDNITTKLV